MQNDVNIFHFHDFTSMSSKDFEKIINLVGPQIFKDTNMRPAIIAQIR